MTIEIISLVISCISVGFGVYQTVNLHKIRTMRDLNLKDVWKKQKDLSGMLIYSDENQHPRSSCGKKSQDLEHDMAQIIAALLRWRHKDLDKLKDKGQIDDFDRNYLRRVLNA
jgi:hypothetical protein